MVYSRYSYAFPRCRAKTMTRTCRLHSRSSRGSNRSPSPSRPPFSFWPKAGWVGSVSLGHSSFFFEGGRIPCVVCCVSRDPRRSCPRGIHAWLENRRFMSCFGLSKAHLVSCMLRFVPVGFLPASGEAGRLRLCVKRTCHGVCYESRVSGV